MHIISHTGIFSSPACLALITFFLPPAKFCFSHDKYVSSEQWLDCARQVCQVTGEKSHLLLCWILPGPGKTRRLRVGSEHIWWWPYSTPPSRAEAVWCTNWGLLMPRLSSVSWTDAPHLFFRASNNTFAWYLVNHDELHLANLFSRLSYRNPLHYDGVWAFCASSWINFTF